MEKPLWSLKFFLLLTLMTLATSTSFSQPDENGEPSTLPTPHIWYGDGPVDGTYLSFEVYNVEPGSTVEFYRTMAGSGEWVQIYPENSDGDYTDGPLKPRTEYGYRVRAVKDGMTSAYSDILFLTTESNYYDAFFSAELRSDNNIELRLTDRSYQDIGYIIYRHVLGEEPYGKSVGSVNALDSGSTYTFIDASTELNTTYVYWVEATINYEGGPYTHYTATDTVTTPSTFARPSFTPLFDQQVHQTDINLVIYNPNDGTSTELYRSPNEAGPYTLIHTQGPTQDEFRYVDEDVKPRTTFYYKARAVHGDMMSEYSDVFTATSMSKFYTPFFEASTMPDLSVNISFQDKSYQDNYYEIYRTNEDGSNKMYIAEDLFLSDSGQTRSFVDYPDPGGVYIYHVDAEVRDEGFPMYYSVATDTAHVLYPTLNAPQFTTPSEFSCGIEVAFGVSNSTPGALTEVYRATERNGEYHVYGTVPSGENQFYSDWNLKPRTTYYYTLRSEMYGQYSDFSDTLELTTGSEFFNPVIDAQLMDDDVVKLTFTDKSYGDGRYEIVKVYSDEDGGYITSIIAEVILPDSGSIEILYDTLSNEPNKVVYTVGAYLACEGQELLPDVAMDQIYRDRSNTLAAPEFDMATPPMELPCGNEIAFNYDNPNPSSRTEIYRSLSNDGQFELIHTSGEEVTFYDRDLISSGTYYYKLRAVSDEAESEFSDTRMFKAGAALSEPEMTYTYIPQDDQINIDIKGTSALIDLYEFYVIEQETDAIYYYDFHRIDSGEVTTIEQYHVVPGRTYISYVNVTLKCDGNPQLVNYVVDTFKVEGGPALFNFVLVDPYTDTDVRDMYLLDEGFAAQGRYNIRVEANDLVQSVDFFLSGEVNGENIEYSWGENQEPYAVFGDRYGDFNLGRLKPGQYSLRATAYSENLRKGVVGNTIATHFEVYDDGSNSLMMEAPSENVRMNVFPNPVVTHAEVEVLGLPNESVHVRILDAMGNTVRSKSDLLDDDGLLLQQWQVGDLKQGTYFVVVKMKDKSTTHRMLIK